ncbi:uncharacterized protein MYCGRDRAFT_82148 [Zymoseptoria tritici IPO323]|uniref:Dolichyl-diphosphooligosaccharide--protein glycosyltransferase subunit 4 n=1 Tax=Zymoseptoria tritici (strain CBS 115943 / IPO323) TaxID=336722 RepID=F9XKB4_ZYMTI|nr:uncharacterized protein MYCGRDRAFT_82148 [Zymoseptoria tritici IPO323]EGP84384.1 hypothetical protein MYCGRDRAFT_82148 [Zymoseptoria tritici IPO323]
MITDASLYSLAVFLGAAAMLLIVLYHFLEVNSDEQQQGTTATKSATIKDNAAAVSGSTSIGSLSSLGVGGKSQKS